MSTSKQSRRRFLARSAFSVGAGAVVPYIFTADAEARTLPQAKNDRPGIGSIGMRYQGTVIAEKATAHGDVVAIADVDRHVREQSRAGFGRSSESFRIMGSGSPAIGSFWGGRRPSSFRCMTRLFSCGRMGQKRDEREFPTLYHPQSRFGNSIFPAVRGRPKIGRIKLSSNMACASPIQFVLDTNRCEMVQIISK